jgi:hypothetical protein
MVGVSVSPKKKCLPLLPLGPIEIVKQIRWDIRNSTAYVPLQPPCSMAGFRGETS